MEQYNRGVWKDVNKIDTGDESWIYAYEPEKNDLRERSTSKKMVAWFFSKTGKVMTALHEQRWQFLSLRRNSKIEQEQTKYCAPWQCELSHKRKMCGQRFLSPEDCWRDQKPFLEVSNSDCKIYLDKPLFGIKSKIILWNVQHFF